MSEHVLVDSIVSLEKGKQTKSVSQNCACHTFRVLCSSRQCYASEFAGLEPSAYCRSQALHCRCNGALKFYDSRVLQAAFPPLGKQ